MTVGVAIAAYNRGPSIRKTLDSVMSQSRRPDAVVVVDDGSVDDTADFIESHYSDVRVVRAPHEGQSSARNRAAQQCPTEIVVHFDSDDVMFPTALARLEASFRQFPQAAAVFADHRYENAVTGRVIENHHHELPQYSRLWRAKEIARVGNMRLYSRELYYPLLYGNLLQQPWAVRRDVFAGLGGFAQTLRSNEDWDLYLRLSHDHLCVVLDEVISTHHVEQRSDHVHLSAGQDESNMAVIRRQLESRGWANPKASLILRRRLAAYYKAFGDREAKAGSVKAARASYLRSLSYWPFDHVVAARALVYPLMAH